MMNLCLLFADMATRAAAKTDVAYHGATTLHPIAAISVLLLGIWFFMASRRMALAPLMILICFIPSAQRIVIFGADFTLLRIMVLFGLARLLVKNELRQITPNRIDYLYLAWIVVGGLAYTIQQADFGAIVFVCGASLDILGAYLVARTLIANIADLRQFAKIASLLAICVSFFFLLELYTGRNLFSVFGGVPATTIVRDDRLRCQGAFAHPILAGVFWASICGLLIGPALAAKNRLLPLAGSISCVAIVGASASSTPVLGLLAAVFFWLCWPLRTWFSYVLAVVPVILVGLHLIMEAPVWHLVARVSAVGGSTAYHRYVLIDCAIKHFDEWWLVGTAWTGHWSEHFQTWDITNQYIFEGVRGGIWRLVLFLCLIVLTAFSIGRSIKRTSRRSDKLLLYGLGASLFVHCVCFIGVSYFGQIQYLWFMTLAIGNSAGTRSFHRELNQKSRGVQASRSHDKIGKYLSSESKHLQP